MSIIKGKKDILRKSFEELTITDKFMFSKVMRNKELCKHFYGELNRSVIIFVCTFDPFGKGRHIYPFENLCKKDSSLALGDGTEKIFINTVGTMEDIDKIERIVEVAEAFAPQYDSNRIYERLHEK